MHTDESVCGTDESVCGSAATNEILKQLGGAIYAYCDLVGFIAPFNLVVLWLQYAQMGQAKRALLKNFKEDIDYEIAGKGKKPQPDKKILPCNPARQYSQPDKKILPCNLGKQYSQPDKKILPCNLDKKSQPDKKILPRGGHNKENIYLTPDCFQKFCMKAGTARADLVRQFYIEIVKGVKRLRTAIDNGDVALVVNGRDSDTYAVARTRVHMSKSHPRLQAVLLKIYGSRAHVIAEIYSALNATVTGMSKKNVADVIEKKKKAFMHRDYMSSQQGKQLDTLLDTLIRRLEADIEIFKKDVTLVKELVEELCTDVKGFCENHLHESLIAKHAKPTMTLEDAKSIEQSRKQIGQ